MKKIICARCREVIDIKKEKWVKMEVYDCQTQISITYYHLNCYKESFKDKVKEIMAKGVAPMVNRLIGGIRDGSTIS